MEATVSQIGPTWNERWTQELRNVADWFDAHPECIPAASGVTFYDFIRESDDGESISDLVARFRAHADMLASPKLETSAGYFNATQQFGPHTVQVTLARDLVLPRPEHPLVPNPDPAA